MPDNYHSIPIFVSNRPFSSMPLLIIQHEFFYFLKKYLHNSTNNTGNTEKFKIIISKRKTNAKTTQTHFLNC